MLLKEDIFLYKDFNKIPNFKDLNKDLVELPTTSPSNSKFIVETPTINKNDYKDYISIPSINIVNSLEPSNLKEALNSNSDAFVSESASSYRLSCEEVLYQQWLQE